MKDNIKLQYESIREAIKQNAESIRTLLKQAHTMTALVAKLDKHTEKTIIDDFNNEIEALNLTITQMFERLENLHNKALELVGSMFKIDS